jgi:outer membrane protein OmpA-like peptidoglycan-associated protein
LLALSLVAGLPALAQVSDHPGFKDPALFTRLPHYFLSADDAFTEVPFDAFEFPLRSDAKQRVEGRHLHYQYQFDEAAGSHAGDLQIVRNYQAAAKRIGGEVLFGDERSTTIRVRKGAQETWVFVESTYQGEQYEINIVEKQAMQQDVKADASALQGGLTQEGHVQVEGIFFDTGKSEVKPESAPAIELIAKLLQANPTLRVWVVGHTDNVGAAESNVTLSNARAAAVIAALTGKHGVDAKRLAPRGVGPFAPVASNENEEGRARNRRVELVKQP